MSRRPRFAFVRIMQETNALSPVLTEQGDFNPVWLEGSELLRACGRFGNEAPKFLRNAELSGFVRGIRETSEAELAPLFSAWAIPSGPLSEPCIQYFEERLERALKQNAPLDGVYLCLHGAMGANGREDPETRLMEVARRAAPLAKIVASHDLHANVTLGRVQAVDALIGYRTNPHRDHFEIGRKCAHLLTRLVKGEVQTESAYRSLPMILGGGNTVDFLAPMRRIFKRMTEMEKDPRVLGVTLFTVHPWLDAKEVGWSTVVITDRDRALAENLADELAELAWSVRNVQPPEFSSIESALADAKKAKFARTIGTVVLADASDVVSAGAPGENTAVLKVLWEQGEGLLTYVPIRDTQVVRELSALPIGTNVEVTVGGKLDPQRNQSLQVRGRIAVVHEDPQFGKRIRLDLEQISPAYGNVKLVLTEGPALAIKPNMYTDLDLPIRDADIVVVKNFFPFRLFFLPYAAKTIYVRSKGVTDLDAAFALDISPPVHPRDEVHDWREVDARRRGIAR